MKELIVRDDDMLDAISQEFLHSKTSGTSFCEYYDTKLAEIGARLAEARATRVRSCVAHRAAPCR